MCAEVQISGPTGPMTVIMAGIISRFPGQPDLVFAAVALAGVFQMVMGALDIGQYIRSARDQGAGDLDQHLHSCCLRQLKSLGIFSKPKNRMMLWAGGQPSASGRLQAAREVLSMDPFIVLCPS